MRAKSREPARRRGRRQVGEAVEGGQKGHLDGKPVGARIGQGRKMPYDVLICIPHNSNLHLFVSLPYTIFFY